MNTYSTGLLSTTGAPCIFDESPSPREAELHILPAVAARNRKRLRPTDDTVQPQPPHKRPKATEAQVPTRDNKFQAVAKPSPRLEAGARVSKATIPKSATQRRSAAYTTRLGSTAVRSTSLRSLKASKPATAGFKRGTAQKFNALLKKKSNKMLNIGVKSQEVKSKAESMHSQSTHGMETRAQSLAKRTASLTRAEE